MIKNIQRKNTNPFLVLSFIADSWCLSQLNHRISGTLPVGCRFKYSQKEGIFYVVNDVATYICIKYSITVVLVGDCATMSMSGTGEHSYQACDCNTAGLQALILFSFTGGSALSLQGLRIMREKWVHFFCWEGLLVA